ncbi:MAG: DUF4337 family protein [Candidatus Tyrphobacter sp.]
MGDFSAADTLHDARERSEQIESGNRIVPVAAAIVAVLAALATLLSNHSSVSGLEGRTMAGILQTRAADQYNYYESSRIKIEVNETLEQSGLVRDRAAVHGMQARIAKEDRKTAASLRAARNDEASSNAQLANAERSLGSYEHYEIAATLFDVSVVLISITALARGTKAPLWLGVVVTAAGLGYFIAGLAHI